MTIKINKDTVIVFDLDDTLYNEIEYLKSAFEEIAYQVDPDDGLQLYAKMFSMYRDNQDVFKYLVENYHKSKKQLLEVYRNHKPSIKPFYRVAKVIEEIKARNGKLGLITDGRVVTQMNKLKSLGLLSHFDKIVISEEIGSEKPSISNYHAIQNHFKASQYWYIGDNFKKDFVTAKQLGWKTLALLDNGLNIHKTNHLYFDLEHIPDFMIKSYADLLID
ncbi:HAD family hydrolase [Spongiivirga sp. MCCC 1A20706]|uniref:HAD family hydrolase n=1 Tax=Spongiivirga sp. MCCC 1A20706 TaxID=3160963 RepID=UPI003977D9C4